MKELTSKVDVEKLIEQAKSAEPYDDVLFDQQNLDSDRFAATTARTTLKLMGIDIDNLNVTWQKDMNT